MRRLVGVLAVALLTVAVPAMAGQAMKGKAASKKTMTAMGTVTAVSATSLSVKGKTGEWTFDVDSSTSVTAKGCRSSSGTDGPTP